MAEVRVEEAYTERDETIDAKGNVTEVEIPYLVFNVADESAALAAARPRVKSVAGMSLESIEVVERINATTWKVKAVYEVDEDGEQPDDDDGGDEDGAPVDAGKGDTLFGEEGHGDAGGYLADGGYAVHIDEEGDNGHHDESDEG